MINLSYLTEEAENRVEIVGEILAYTLIIIAILGIVFLIIIYLYSIKQCNKNRDEMLKTTTNEEKAKILEWQRYDRLYFPKKEKKK